MVILAKMYEIVFKIVNDTMVTGLVLSAFTALWTLYSVIIGLVGWNASY